LIRPTDWYGTWPGLAEVWRLHQRAILLLCFLYDNPGFEVLPSTHHRAVKSRVAQAIRRGVELRQVNLAMDQTGVRVQSYHRFDPRLVGQPSGAD
jgi:sugar fermentation stimulation protein A